MFKLIIKEISLYSILLATADVLRLLTIIFAAYCFVGLYECISISNFDRYVENI